MRLREPHPEWTLIVQGDAKYIQNQQFYRSTVKAIEAQRNAGAAEQPKPVVPQAPHPEVPKAQPEEPKHDDGQQKQQQEMEEIPIAGRTKMTVPKNKDDASKQQEQGHVADELAEAKEELNGILKRSPSMFQPKILTTLLRLYE